MSIYKSIENEPLQAQCLSVYCVEVWQIDQGIIVKLAKLSHCLSDFLAQSVLCILVMSKSQKSATQGTGSRMRCGKNKCAKVILDRYMNAVTPTSFEPQALNLEDGLPLKHPCWLGLLQ